MVRVLLVRHANGPHVGRILAGRAGGSALDDAGHAQAEQLAARLARWGVTAIRSSPLERALRTAQPLADLLGLDVQPCDAFTELDYGEWTGVEYGLLGDDPAWRDYNGFRSATRIPGGETMLEAQARAVGELLGWRDRHPDGTVVVVSHADVIRSVLAYFLGMPLDLAQRLAVDPASVSELELHGSGVLVRHVNDTGPPESPAP